MSTSTFTTYDSEQRCVRPMRAAERRDAIQDARRELREYLTGGCANTDTDALDCDIYTLTDYGRGMTDYVRVFVIGTSSDGCDREIHELTWLVARATDGAFSDRGLPFGGGNYSKALEAFCGACRAAGVAADQSRWRKL